MPRKPTTKGGEIALQKARKLRKEMTPQERRLWYCYLRKSKYHWYRQRIIDFYIVDFYCPAAKLIIEIDGNQHFTTDGKTYDKIRTSTLNSYGIEVIRFPNRQIDNEFDDICKSIESQVGDRIKRLQRDER